MAITYNIHQSAITLYPGVIFPIFALCHMHSLLTRTSTQSASSWVKPSTTLGRRHSPSEIFSLTIVFCIANLLGNLDDSCVYCNTKRIIIIIQICRHGTRPKLPNPGHLAQIWSPIFQAKIATFHFWGARDPPATSCHQNATSLLRTGTGTATNTENKDEKQTSDKLWRERLIVSEEASRDRFWN